MHTRIITATLIAATLLAASPSAAQSAAQSHEDVVAELMQRAEARRGQLRTDHQSFSIALANYHAHRVGVELPAFLDAHRSVFDAAAGVSTMSLDMRDPAQVQQRLHELVRQSRPATSAMSDIAAASATLDDAIRMQTTSALQQVAGRYVQVAELSKQATAAGLAAAAPEIRAIAELNVSAMTDLMANAPEIMAAHLASTSEQASALAVIDATYAQTALELAGPLAASLPNGCSAVSVLANVTGDAAGALRFGGDAACSPCAQAGAYEYFRLGSPTDRVAELAPEPDDELVLHISDYGKQTQSEGPSMPSVWDYPGAPKIVQDAAGHVNDLLPKPLPGPTGVASAVCQTSAVAADTAGAALANNVASQFVP